MRPATAVDENRVHGASPSLEEAFEPAAKKLGNLSMALADVGCAMSRVVDENAQQLGDHAKALQRELKRMDDLVFSSVEVLDDLFTLVRDHLAALAERANSVLPVNALDAYLDGVTTLPPKTATQTTQTNDRTDGAAIVVTPSPSPMAVPNKTAHMSSLKMFDLLRGLHRQRESKPKVEVKPEVAASGPSTGGAKKRLRSPTSTDGDGEGDREIKKPTYHRTPVNSIKDRRPVAVHGVRERLSQREYAVEFEGLEEHVWLVSRRAPPAARVLIQAYAKSLRRKRHRLKQLAEEEEAPKNKQVIDVGEGHESEELDAEGIYIVEKIVDHRFRYGKKQYYVKWDGYDTDENTWEPAAKLRSEVGNIVDDYERELAKAASRKANAETLPSKLTALRVGLNLPVKAKLGRPSNPSALTKSAPSTATGSAELLKRSGKIPKVQFLINENDTDDDEDEEDSDLQRLATSDQDYDEDSDEEVHGSKVIRFEDTRRRTKRLSPQVE